MFCDVIPPQKWSALEEEAFVLRCKSFPKGRSLSPDSWRAARANGETCSELKEKPCFEMLILAKTMGIEGTNWLCDVIPVQNNWNLMETLFCDVNRKNLVLRC